MKRGLLRFAAIGIALTAASGAQAAPVTQDNFMLKTTGDLVALCGADQSDPMYTAAISYCHGFAVGTYRMLEIEEAASRNKNKTLCVQQSALSRAEAINKFVSWAGGNGQVMNDPPTEGFGQFVYQSFPCKK